jgi:hypothetical protein
MARPPKPITIDGTPYKSIAEAARTFGVDHRAIAHLINRTGNTALASTNIKRFKKVTTPVRLASTKPISLSWQFVYDQITSSPKNRSVVCSPAAI